MAPILVIAAVAVAGTSLISWTIWTKLRRARRAEYIRTFSLPQGLYEKLQKHHPHLALKDCQLVGKGLRQYFLAYQKADGKYVSMPSQVVDDLWHEFILYTKQYQAFCKQAFGNFMHHIPAAVLKSGSKSNEGLRRVWWHTCREELINPKEPTRLPLLFALDAKLRIKDGFHYSADCNAFRQKFGGALANSATSGVIYCGGDFADSSIDGGTSGFDSWGSSDSGSDSGGNQGDGGSDGGGGDGGGGCGGGCGSE